MLSKDRSLSSINAKFVPRVKLSLINSRKWIVVGDFSDVTLRVNATPLTVEDRLLANKDFAN